MGLTRKHYFSQKSNLKYMGSSQFKAFLKCEAAALAEVRGEYVRPKSTALLVGSYVDSYFEGTLDEFKRENPEIFNSRTGQLKADYIQAEQIIRKIESSPLMMKYLAGKKQVVKTGTIEGVPVKIKMDSYHKGKAIVDLKIMKDLYPVKVPDRGLINFAEAWGYDIQAAIYQEIEGDELPFFIAAATKQDPPDLDVIRIPEKVIANARTLVHAYIEHFDQVKKGVIPPVRCERCEYCRSTKTLDRVKDLSEFDPVL